jgi:hypothetical protein
MQMPGNYFEIGNGYSLLIFIPTNYLFPSILTLYNTAVEAPSIHNLRIDMHYHSPTIYRCMHSFVHINKV